jgi:hypothetical protein
VRIPGSVLRQRRVGLPCAATVAVLVLSPLTALAGPARHSPRATLAAVGGTVYGGATSQDFPVVIETSRNGRKVAKAIIGIRLTCTSGGVGSVPDGYTALPVNRKRKFHAAFGPISTRNDDGTTTDFEGSITGRFNKSRTKVSGKWSLKATDHAATGAITDTCDSGSVSWRAKQ